MADQVKLFTQADLATLNAQLDVILKNLNTHVNMSLSKAHSFKALTGVYRDSGGDQVNKMLTNGVMDIILEFQFGEPPANTAIYVPARIVSATTLPDNDPGPRTLGNGITFIATSPAGTSTSPGVPMSQKALVTTSPAQVAYEQAVVANDLLILHQLCSVNDTRELQCHGGISFSTDSILDSLSHTIGRKTLNIGWGSVLYKLPGDNLITGPPQVLRQVRIVTSGAGNPYHNRYHSSSDNQGVGSAFLLSYFGNTATIVWQVNVSSGPNMSGTWVDMNPSGGAASGVCAGGEPGSTFFIPGSSAYCTITFINATNDFRFKQFVRVKATTPEGAVAFSNVCCFTGSDTDGSWGVTWYGVPEYSAPTTTTFTDHVTWLPGAATLYH
jgi:hypothetical protein